MKRTPHIGIMRLLGIAAIALVTGAAHAALPAPNPQQAALAAQKKAAADAQAQKDKETLLATMDAISDRWRARAAKEGWPTHAPVPVAAPAAAVSAPTTAATTAPVVAVRSEKAGTAAPSEDIKKRQTQAVPKGTPPTVNAK
ncbi:hypothetical protein [Pseudoduganella buxea]|uniref:DUF4148 domain-containing protein n=1 Tax=Pseudoduganella buxea TaxID=1949069 RepID=A0ABQ1KN71_9BURK|nr:hypothetical protein [Pseudoduganella buxea]GGC02053.1 hypothetical protein GCM10011572_24980 [Pseudoduganella buxea]